MRSDSMTAVLIIALAPTLASAGHSAPSHIDGGQSEDGRYVVTAERVDGPKTGQAQKWKFTWKDTKEDKANTGDLQGASGYANYSHIFVSPNGETFALWAPLALFSPDGKELKPPSKETPAFKDFEGFKHRLVIFKNTGEIVKDLGVGDLIKPEEWAGVTSIFNRAHWLREYPGLSYRSTIRSGYALYRVSPDYTVLEFLVGTKPRRVRLSDGAALEEKDWSKETAKVPVQPFKGPKDTNAYKRDAIESYQPSLDPVRSEGKFGSGK